MEAAGLGEPAVLVKPIDAGFEPEPYDGARVQLEAGPDSDALIGIGIADSAGDPAVSDRESEALGRGRGGGQGREGEEEHVGLLHALICTGSVLWA